jgi:hypothetical protein
MERRINRLEVIWRRRAALTAEEPELNLSRLSAEEQAELEALIVLCRAHATPTDRSGVKALTDHELERLCQLGSLAQGLEPRAS